MDRGEIHRCEVIATADIENGVSIPELEKKIELAVKHENYEAAAGIKQAIEKYQNKIKEQMGESI